MSHKTSKKEIYLELLKSPSYARSVAWTMLNRWAGINRYRLLPGKKKQLPIFHIASMARSGETLLQKCLSQHSRICIVHNLSKSDPAHERILFTYLKESDTQTLPFKSSFLRKYDVKNDSIMVLKQGTWEHHWPFKGFILARNPAAIYASLKTFDIKTHGSNTALNWKNKMVPRLQRWLADIDPELIPDLERLSPIEQFALFYNRRMGVLLKTGLPIIHYEKFVLSPKEVMKRICNILGIAYEQQMTQPESTNTQPSGHGYFDFSRSIDTRSLLKYLKYISEEEFDQIKILTGNVASQYKYHLEWGTSGVEKDADMKEVA